MKRLSVSFVSVLFCCVAALCVCVMGVVPVAAVAADSVAVAAPVVESSALAVVLAAAPDWLQALTLLIGGASAIAALTPTPKDDGVLRVLRKIIDVLALNVLGAKNEQPDKTFKSGQ